MHYSVAHAAIVINLTFGQIACQNANHGAVPVKARLGGSVTFNCPYTGSGKVQAVSWFNGSSAAVLMLMPSSQSPECDKFSTDDASYNPSRLQYTCDTSSLKYSLTIDPLQAVDHNVKWSCTFLDPQPNSNRLEFIIDISSVGSGGHEISSVGSEDITAVIIIIVVVLLVIGFACITVAVMWVHKKQNGTYRTGEGKRHNIQP